VLIDGGLSGSATFHLVDTLNASDVVVYVEPKLTRQAWAAIWPTTSWLKGDTVISTSPIETQGAKRRLGSLLAHELQHVVEVAQAPEARDAESLDRMFIRLAVKFGCDGTTCTETQAAKDIEHPSAILG